MRNLGPNEALIGREGSRRRLATPALVLDLDAFEHNLGAMAAHFAERSSGFRPHAKTHKSAEIARRQMAAGAVGVCVAKLGEAEALAQHGIERLLVTSPLATADKIERLLDLDERMEELMLVVDSPRGVELVASAAARRSKPLQVLVDLGVGRNRTGAPGVAAAAALAGQVAARSSLVLRGLQCYAGHVQHLEDHAEREAEAGRVIAYVRRARDAIEAKSGPLDIVTGGGTGTYDVDSDSGVFTDVQAGSFVFMDVQYNAIERRGGAGPFRTSLFVHTSVISANVAGVATTDAGFKAFATDGPEPGVHAGAPEGTTYGFMGDEHGQLVLPAGANGPEIGEVVECVTPHCDPTVNLHDFYHCVRGERLVDIWRIDARGRTW